MDKKEIRESVIGDLTVLTVEHEIVIDDLVNIDVDEIVDVERVDKLIASNHKIIDRANKLIEKISQKGKLTDKLLDKTLDLKCKSSKLLDKSKQFVDEAIDGTLNKSLNSDETERVALSLDDFEPENEVVTEDEHAKFIEELRDLFKDDLKGYEDETAKKLDDLFKDIEDDSTDRLFEDSELEGFTLEEIDGPVDWVIQPKTEVEEALIKEARDKEKEITEVKSSTVCGNKDTDKPKRDKKKSEKLAVEKCECTCGCCLEKELEQSDYFGYADVFMMDTYLGCLKIEKDKKVRVIEGAEVFNPLTDGLETLGEDIEVDSLNEAISLLFSMKLDEEDIVDLGIYIEMRREFKEVTKDELLRRIEEH